MAPTILREILARLGFRYTSLGDHIMAPRRKPYAHRWRKAYCGRRLIRAIGATRNMPDVLSVASFSDWNSLIATTRAEITDQAVDSLGGVNVAGAGDFLYDVPYLGGRISDGARRQAPEYTSRSAYLM